MSDAPAAIRLEAEGRFSRLEAIQWWEQDRLGDARVLVVGAGALGNEVIKDLALLGVGQLAIADRDRVEASNLCRSVLFRAADQGELKAEVAARAARAIYPGLRAIALPGNVMADIGLGWFRWAHVVVGALDNREARVFVNAVCARLGRPWIDGGIEVLQGIVRGFHPPATSCYECTMSEVDWSILNQRRSCALLARRALAERGQPTTPTSAAVIGAVQAQEVVKYLHGREALLGRGWVFEGLAHGSYVVVHPRNPDCPRHDPVTPVEADGGVDSSSSLRILWERAARRLGGLDAIDLEREIVRELECPACGRRDPVFRPIDAVDDAVVPCPDCRTERTPVLLHSLGPEPALLDRPLAALGLPRWDIVWARKGDRVLGIEIAGDRPEAAGAGGG